MKKPYKLGLDLHGVSDKIPEFFSLISKLMVENGHEVHIMTGEHIGGTLHKQLEDCGLYYTHIFSIADWHKEKGTQMRYDSEGNPWMDANDWDSSKGNYAEEKGLNLVIDDTVRYSSYFKKCIFMSTDIHLPEDRAKRWAQLHREGWDAAAANKTWIRKDRNLEGTNFPNVIGVLCETKDQNISFQDIIDFSYNKGYDLYRLVHQKYTDVLSGDHYHFFLREPFEQEDQWEVCLKMFEENSDSRLFKQ